jgi:hypothetical protein
MKNKRLSLLTILIDFFASVYDMPFIVFDSLIDFFASIYDLVFAFMIFLVDYVKWLTTISPSQTNGFNTHVGKPIQIHSQSPFEIR